MSGYADETRGLASKHECYYFLSAEYQVMLTLGQSVLSSGDNMHQQCRLWFANHGECARSLCSCPPQTPIQYTTHPMVLSILIATITAPGLLGSQEAIRQSQSKEKREEHRARRCNLIATCVKSSNRSREINGRQIVLRNGKLWIDTGTEDGSPLGHPYAGYYLPYPDTKYEGLVTTITDAAPIMNWVYVDKETCEVKYGVRAEAQPHLTGPFDCTRQDRRLTFDGWEGWCAVEQAPGLWGLYFDLDDDGLRSRLEPGTRVLEIELSRKEKRFQKEVDTRHQDQTTNRAVDVREDAPIDQPLAAEAVMSKPGVVDEDSGKDSEQKRQHRPMKIPQSIFENPPPIVEPLVFRPATPPPAYTPTTKDGLAKAAATVPIKQDGNRSRLDDERVLDRSFPLPTQIQTKPDKEGQGTSLGADPSPDELQLSSTNVKHTTPKLNRSSGSRALTQAQKFEAMAAVQNPQDEVRKRSRERASRASSTTSSVYSNENEKSKQPTTSTQPQTSPTPAPLALALSKAKQAKELATRAQVPTLGNPILNPYVQPPVTPPRRRAISVREGPPIFGPQNTSSSQRSIAPRASPTPRISAQKSTPQPNTQKPAFGRPQRERSTLEQPSLAPPSLRPTTKSATALRGQTLARTMTSGKGNQGMRNRIGGGVAGRDRNVSEPGRQIAPAATTNRLKVATTRKKTTSALFREIDDLIGQEGRGAAGAKAEGKVERK